MYLDFLHKHPAWGLWFMSTCHQFTILDLSLCLLVAESELLMQVFSPATAGALVPFHLGSARLRASFLGPNLVKLILTSLANMVWVILWTCRMKKEEKPLFIWLVLFFFKTKLHYIPDLTPDRCRHSLFWLHFSKGRWFPLLGRVLHLALWCAFSRLTLNTLYGR